jgi:hypothetical protein
MTQNFPQAIQFHNLGSNHSNFDVVTFDPLTIEPDNHQFNQNYFTKDQFFQQPGYQVIRNK